jgi:capsule polysaccharide export protein KpsE/RkpR
MPDPSNPKIEVSWGELIDKITILEIKESRLASPQALAGVRRELHLLQSAARDIASNPEVSELKTELSSVNQELWQIEDDIRAREASQTFDARFIELARLVYTRNDHRAALKYRINQVTNSAVVEHKQYTRYDGEPDREPGPL